MARILNSAEFYRGIKNSDKLIVIDFFAVWCGPCKMLTPIFESLSTEMSEFVSFGKIDIDKSLEIAEKYEIVSVPTMLMFRDGVEVDRIVGFVPKDQIKSKINAHL